MAKKSAKSKGYRKTVAKKPYLSKKEIIWTCAIVVALILIVVLFNVFYDDGSLKIVDGVAQTSGANSLILNDGSANSPHYYKLGQLAEVEGYTLSATPVTSDENVNTYTFTPVEDSAIDSVTFNAYGYSATAFCEAMVASFSSSDDVVCSELQTVDVDGHTVSYFTYHTTPTVEEESAETDVEAAEPTAEPESADAETSEPVYVQALNAYVSVGERCIILHVRNDAESEADYVDDAALVDVMNQMLGALSFETK